MKAASRAEKASPFPSWRGFIEGTPAIVSCPKGDYSTITRENVFLHSFFF